MPHDAALIATVAAGIGAAFLFGLVAVRLGLPPLVGYLVAGIVVGPFTPGFVADSGLSSQLAELGVILLMFGVGLHFSLRDLAAVRHVVLPGALAQATVTTILGAVIGRLWGLDVGGAVVLGLSVGVASTVVLLKALERRDRLDSPEGRLAVSLVSRSLLGSMTPYSLRVFAMSLSALAIFQTDAFIVGAFLPVATVTVYTGAYRIYQVCRQITYALINPLVPDAARATALDQPARVQALLSRGTKYSNGLTLLLAVPAILFAEPLLVAWAGADFGEGAPALQVLLLSLLANNNHLVAFALLTGVGRIGAYLRYQTLWAAANLVLSLALVERIGLVGVALGTALPVVVLEPFYLRTAVREIGVDGRRFLVDAVLRPSAAALVAAVPVLGALALTAGVTPMRAVGLSVAYAALFSFAFYRLSIDQADRRLVGRMLHSIPRPSALRQNGTVL